MPTFWYPITGNLRMVFLHKGQLPYADDYVSSKYPVLLKKALAHSGICTAAYSSHAVRIGAAMMAAANGVSMVDWIQLPHQAKTTYSGHQPRDSWWMFVDGSRWDALEEAYTLCRWPRSGAPPEVVVIHLGSNDLGHVTCCEFHTALLRLHRLLPNTCIVWSDMLPRRYWHSARFPGKLEAARIKVNKRIANRVRELGGIQCLLHQIQRQESDLYAWEGVHLSHKKLDIFIQDIRCTLAAICR